MKVLAIGRIKFVISIKIFHVISFIFPLKLKDLSL